METILLPTKIYYRRGAFKTVAHEILAPEVVVVTELKYKTAYDTVEAMLRLKTHATVYCVIVDPVEPTTQSIASLVGILQKVKPLSLVTVGGATTVYHAVAAMLQMEARPELVCVGVDAKPIPIMNGLYKINGEIKRTREVIPDFVVLDSGIANPSKGDVELLMKANKSSSLLSIYCETAQNIGEKLLKDVDERDPVWCEAAVNLCGIVMASKPDDDVMLPLV